VSEPSVDDRRDFFDQLYVTAAAGGDAVPWDRDGAPQPLLADWAAELIGAGRSAVVVGCGLGGDAEFLARLGFVTTGFDFSPPAIEAARRLFPGSPVDYAVADLFALPPEWAGRYDFVLEAYTVQSLPRSVRPRVVDAVRSLVAPGGSVLVIAGQQGHWPEAETGPWPLSRADVESFAGGGFTAVRVEEPPASDGSPRWRAEFRRDAS
jgi:SAM-dependent methyltransferase